MGGVSRVVLGLAVAAALQPALARDFTRPTHYSQFVSVASYPSLAEAIENEEYLYLPGGDYIVENPIVIDRETPLVIHGGDRMVTRLRAADPTKPLFLVREATLLNLTGLKLWPAFDPGTGGSTLENARSMLIENTLPMELEIVDAFLAQSVVEIRGPGSFRIQSTFIAGNGWVDSPVVVDHPDADYVMVAGNINNGVRVPSAPSDEVFHTRQKRGRVRIFGTGVQIARGIADFRIDSASRLGPHAIVNVRSEGSNGFPAFPSAHLYVPPSADPVDVLFFSNGGNWNPAGEGHFVEYHAAGTLWMLGNNSTSGAGTLVIGDTSSATIVAFGNRLYDDDLLFPVDTGSGVHLGNVWSYQAVTGNPDEPHARFVDPDGEVGDFPSIPAVPRLDLPLPIDRPVADVPMSDMINVKDPPYSAVGDGVADDTAAIQAAFNDGKVIYLPAGTYRTTQPLGFVHTVYGGVGHPAGGWIAGAGSGLTTIRRDLADKGSVLLSDGMAYATVQGITFETAAFDPGDPSPIQESNVGLDNVTGFGHATQEVMFYDCRFVGGKHALAFGQSTTTNCSENLMVNCEFRDAEFGLASGSFNALANIAYDSSFHDNQIAMGHDGNLRAGSWAVYHGSVSGTEVKDFELLNSASDVWYFHELSTDSPKVVQRDGGTGAAISLLFDQSSFAPSPANDPVFDFITGGGMIFLDTEVDPGAFRHAGMLSVSYGFKLHSEIPAWGSANVGAVHRLYEIDADPDGDDVLHPDDICPEDADAGQADTDLDGAGDACDCADLDATAFALPGEVEGLRLHAGGRLTWYSLQPGAGSGTAFEVFRESGSSDPAGTAPDGTCLVVPLDGEDWTDPDQPSPEQHFRYLLGARNACGVGPWGESSVGSPPAVCP